MPLYLRLMYCYYLFCCLQTSPGRMSAAQLLKPLEPYHQEVCNAVMYDNKGQGEAVLSGLNVTCTMLSWWGKNAVPTEQQIPNRFCKGTKSVRTCGGKVATNSCCQTVRKQTGPDSREAAQTARAAAWCRYAKLQVFADPKVLRRTHLHPRQTKPHPKPRRSRETLSLHLHTIAAQI